MKLTWFNPKEMFNTCCEWHTFLEGIADGFCLWEDNYAPWDMGESNDENCLECIRKEHHYYNAGRIVGQTGLIVLISGMIVWIIGAIHGV